MMERFGRGVVMSWRENNIKTEEQGGEERSCPKHHIPKPPIAIPPVTSNKALTSAPKRAHLSMALMFIGNAFQNRQAETIVAGKEVLYYNSRLTSSGCKWIRTSAQTPMVNKQEMLA
ncbi:hypothetical protein J6590_106232 [Homalodisca vitripennis]|nr:hypothetical protein J6590_106232 [Homalodisca vitripennis]